MHWRALLLCVLLASGAPLFARTPAARVLDQAINTLVVKGAIEIDADGRVRRYTVEHPEAYSAAVREMLDRIVPQWTFRPVLVDGAPGAARSAMYLRLRADPIGGGQFRIVVAGATFGDDGTAAPGTQVAVDLRAMPHPNYPKAEALAHIGAQVLVVVRIGRDGRVEDAIAEQTNLDQLGTPRAMARWRRDFEAAAIAGLKRWTFVTPIRGSEADAPYWSARIPVTYTPGHALSAGTPGKWNSYVPGPRRGVPWATDEEQALARAGSDAFPGSGIFPLKPALQLLTPLGAG